MSCSPPAPPRLRRSATWLSTNDSAGCCTGVDAQCIASRSNGAILRTMATVRRNAAARPTSCRAPPKGITEHGSTMTLASIVNPLPTWNSPRSPSADTRHPPKSASSTCGTSKYARPPISRTRLISSTTTHGCLSRCRTSISANREIAPSPTPARATDNLSSSPAPSTTLHSTVCTSSALAMALLMIHHGPRRFILRGSSGGSNRAIRDRQS